MGRLFWKFFFAFLLALLAAGLAVGLVLSMLHPRAEFKEHLERWSAGRVEAATRMLSLLERDELVALWTDWRAAGEFVPLAVDVKGIELLGRPYRAEWMVAGREAILADGEKLHVFADPQGLPGLRPLPARDAPGAPETGRRAPPPRPLGPPLPELFVGLLAALAFSAVLAWYLSKPLRHLQQGLEALGEGRLDTRVGARMGRRRDEIADLGRRFDSMAGRLEKLMGAQRRLLHDVSHELRSPLARLAAAIGLLRQDPSKLDAGLERIERESARLDLLVGELLTLSRLEAGAQAEAPTPVALGELLQELAEDAGFEGRERGCKVEVDCDGDPVVMGQAELLYRAFDNVLRNAVRHSPAGGRIAVVLRGEADLLRVSVADEGQGVAEAALDSIFDPFQRAGATDGHGFGLGLAIARRAIEAHGGSIAARNRPAGGLEIEIILPRT